MNMATEINEEPGGEQEGLQLKEESKAGYRYFRTLAHLPPPEPKPRRKARWRILVVDEGWIKYF
jgi:hypothetical protein